MALCSNALQCFAKHRKASQGISQQWPGKVTLSEAMAMRCVALYSKAMAKLSPVMQCYGKVRLSMVVRYVVLHSNGKARCSRVTNREVKFSNGDVALGAVRQWQGAVEQGTAKA